MEDILITDALSGKCRDKASEAHNVNHVSQTYQLFEFRARDDDRAALLSGDAAKQHVNFRSRPYVNAVRRLFGQQNLDIVAQRTRQRHLLLITTAPIGQRSSGVTGEFLCATVPTSVESTTC
jgi:hypothetical protein